MIRVSLRRFFHTTVRRDKILKMSPYTDAHFRCKEGCETFEFTFFLKHDTLKISRNFNFNRRITESVGEFQSRVVASLEKSISKKNKKKSKEGQASADAVKVQFKVDGEEAETSAICKDMMLSSSGVTMHFLDLSYKIQINSPVVNAIALPESILAGFPVYPSKLDVDYAERQDCQLIWFRSVKKLGESENKEQAKYEQVATGYSYIPIADDIGHAIKLRCEPVKGDLKGPAMECVAKNVISAGPGHCPFQTRHLFTQDFLSGSKFRIMTYNILADFYTDSDYSREVLFPYCPPYALDIDYRKQLILKEIIGYKADLICLQEVDHKVFDVDLEPVLGSEGYSGTFNRKGGQVSEGIACFYRNSTFTLEHQECLNLSQEITENPLFAVIHEAIIKNEALKSRILDRGSVLQLVVLRHTASNHILVIGITHLYFHPDADHVRLLQAATCLSILQHKHKLLSERDKCSLILCGDFNSTPPFGVYKFMTEGYIPKDYPDWKSNENEVVEGLELDHSMKLESACGCPKYTNFTVGFADCLDYIFYQTDNLRVTQVVPFPSDEELQEHTAIPSVVQPSDHVALIADLEITHE